MKSKKELTERIWRGLIRPIKVIQFRNFEHMPFGKNFISDTSTIGLLTFRTSTSMYSPSTNGIQI
jgi:hypothetical protein